MRSEQPKIKGKIEFRHLTFAYDGKPVLKDINLTIRAGQNRRFRRQNRQRKINVGQLDSATSGRAGRNDFD